MLQQTVGLQLRYFCGITRTCARHNAANLERAKTNIRDNFVTVMIVEQMKLSSQVLEHMMPSIFRGLVERYVNPVGRVDTEIHSRKNHARVNEKATLRPATRAFLLEKVCVKGWVSNIMGSVSNNTPRRVSS